MKRTRKNLGCLLALAFLILLFQAACSTNDPGMDESYITLTNIVLSAGYVEIYPGQTATVTATLKDEFGNTLPGDWFSDYASQHVKSVGITPSSGASTVSVSITANPDATNYLPDTQDINMGYAGLSAYPKGPLMQPSHIEIRVILKQVQVAVLTQTATIDLSNSLVTGKCVFAIKNDSSSDTYNWSADSVVQNPSAAIFVEDPVLGPLPGSGRTAEFTWTQKLSSPTPESGFISYKLNVHATSDKSPQLNGVCTPGASIFYSKE